MKKKRKCKYPDIPCQQYHFGKCFQGSACWYSHADVDTKNSKKKLHLFKTTSTEITSVTIFDLKVQIARQVDMSKKLSFSQLCKIYSNLNIYQLECFPLNSGHDTYVEIFGENDDHLLPGCRLIPKNPWTIMRMTNY